MERQYSKSLVSPHSDKQQRFAVATKASLVARSLELRHVDLG